MANVEVHHSVSKPSGNWTLCFQWVSYHYDGEKESLDGYRFIWEKPDGSLQPARGQARIPNSAMLFDLIQKACEDGWFSRIEHENIIG